MNRTLRAQLVMRREDGASILDSEPGHGNVSQARAEAIRKRLAEMGFDVEEGNLNTLSIVGPSELFDQHFGMREASKSTEPATALSSSRIPEELVDFVSGVFVVPPPEFF